MNDDNLQHEVEQILGGPSTPNVSETPPAEIWDNISKAVRSDEDNVTAITGAQSKPLGKWLFATAAAFVILALAGLALSRSNGSTKLLAIGDIAASGTAQLDGDQLKVDVDLDDASEEEYFEVWLIQLDNNSEVADLVSLGRQTELGLYNVPDNVDTSQFSVVDVSLEADDGNPGHSGNSVLRGDLTEL